MVHGPITEMESETDSTSIATSLMQCYNHRDKFDSTVKLPKFISVIAHYASMHAIYIVLASFNYTSQGNV